MHYRISLALLIIIVLLERGGRAIYFSSVQAMTPGFVDTRDLEQANGILSGTEAGAENLAGPVVGTVLFSAAKALPFVADGFALLASCLPFIGFHPKNPRPRKTPLFLSPSMLEGVRLLFADRRLRVLLFLVASLAGLQGMESGVLVLLRQRNGASPRAPTVSSWRRGPRAPSSAVSSPMASRRRFGAARTLIAAAIALASAIS